MTWCETCQGWRFSSLNCGRDECRKPQSLDIELGCNLDMTDADRLRDWARLLDTHGSDVSHWASVPHLVKRMIDLADRVEKEVSEVGQLRAKYGS